MTWERFIQLLPIVTLVLGYLGSLMVEAWRENRTVGRENDRERSNMQRATMLESQDDINNLLDLETSWLSRPVENLFFLYAQHEVKFRVHRSRLHDPQLKELLQGVEEHIQILGSTFTRRDEFKPDRYEEWKEIFVPAMEQLIKAVSMYNARVEQILQQP